MAFGHGKNTRVYVDAYDLSRFFSEVSMAGKVEMADTTTFAAIPGIAVAKTVLPGVKDGTLQLKGLFDPTGANTSSPGSDIYFAQLIAEDTGVGSVLTPSNVDACVSISPTGSWVAGTRVIAAANVLSQYQISSPVKNAVSIQADMQADGGIDTGVSLHDPSTSDTIPTPALIAASASISGSTITVLSTTSGYATAGQILIPVTGGYQTITYTGVSGSTFTGCSGGTGTSVAGAVLQLIPGTGANDLQLPPGSGTTLAYGATPVNGSGLALTTAAFTFVTTATPFGIFPAQGQFLCPISAGTAVVTYTGLSYSSPFGFTGCTVATAKTATASSSVTMPPIPSITGAYAFLHIGALTGISAAVTYAKLQSSDDNSTWVDVPSGVFTLTPNSQAQQGSGQYSNANGGPGGYILFIPAGIQILRYVRVVLAYASPTTAATVLVTFVRL